MLTSLRLSSIGGFCSRLQLLLFVALMWLSPDPHPSLILYTIFMMSLFLASFSLYSALYSSGGALTWSFNVPFLKNEYEFRNRERMPRAVLPSLLAVGELVSSSLRPAAGWKNSSLLSCSSLSELGWIVDNHRLPFLKQMCG